MLKFSYKTNLLKKLNTSETFLYDSNKFFFSFLQNQQKNLSIDHDTIFVRHAHSSFNEACQNYRIKNNLEYDWDKLVKHQGFTKAVAFNPDYIDSALTEKGIEQCYLTSKNINIEDFNLIMVSPHQRALQTCQHLIRFSKKQFNHPIIVQPLISGSLWSSCDISIPIQEKIKEFKKFDFSRLKKASDLWFISNLKEQDKRIMFEEIQRRKISQYKDKQKLVLQLIQQKHIQEDRQILRNRAWKIKQMMIKVKQNHQKMLIISHYYIIQYVNTKYFNQNDHSPVEQVNLKNCYPYYNRLQDMLNYK